MASIRDNNIGDPRAAMDPQLIKTLPRPFKAMSRSSAKMLDEHPQLAHATNDGRSMLHEAVETNRITAIRLLVERGAKVDLFCAAGMGRLNDVVAFFDGEGKLKPGASITGSTRRRSDGSRILELSSDCGHFAVNVSRLISPAFRWPKSARM